MMNPKIKAEVDFDINQFKRRVSSVWQLDYATMSERFQARLFAQAAFTVLCRGIAEHFEYIYSQGVAVNCKLEDSTFHVGFGLRRITYQCSLSHDAATINYIEKSPSSGNETLRFSSRWPSEVTTIEQLREPVEAFANDMRAFLLNGRIPS